MIDFPENEIEFQRKLVTLLRGQGWMADRLNDAYLNGLPDITAAKFGLGDFWIEAKCCQTFFNVNDTLTLDHPLSARQRKWLESRADNGCSTCGVLVAWRSGIEADPIDYASWVPIGFWNKWLGENLMTWVLRRHTCGFRDLARGVYTLSRLIHGIPIGAGRSAPPG